MSDLKVASAAPVVKSERRLRIEAAIEAWFTSGKIDIRTPEQLEREKLLFGKFQFNRLMIPLAVLTVQICIGSLYSWSMFNSFMDKNAWKTTGINANAFTISVAMFGLSTLIFGNWAARNGPRKTVTVTLFFTPIGWAGASLGSYVESFPLMAILYGVFHGFGAGLGYISSCSCAQKWFPELKGFATGVAVMGFGVGSFIWTTIGKALLDVKGSYVYSPFQVQAIFAVVFFCGIFCALPFLRDPHPEWKPDSKSLDKGTDSYKDRFFRMLLKPSTNVAATTTTYTFLEAVQLAEFQIMMVVVFCQFICGVVFLSSAADMTSNIFGYDADFGTFIASMQNLANFTGRFGWGLVSDKIGRKTFYLFALLVQTFSIGLMIVWIEKQIFGLWLLSFLLVGSMYGGGFGVLPAFLSDIFGPKISAATHGCMLVVWSLATCIGVPIFTWSTGYYSTLVAGKKIATPYAYIYNAYWLCGLPALGFVVLLFLNIRPKDRALRTWFHDARIRIFSKVIRITFMDEKKQEAEWSEYEHAKTPLMIESVAAPEKIAVIDDEEKKEEAEPKELQDLSNVVLAVGSEEKKD